MRRDQRTPEELFDDLLADDNPLDEIAFWLGWPIWRTITHYRKVCADLGELPDEI